MIRIPPDMMSDKIEESHLDEPHDDAMETDATFSATLTNLLRQMMFVSGETAEPSVETTTLIEEIVRQQVVEIVCAPLIVC